MNTRHILAAAMLLFSLGASAQRLTLNQDLVDLGQVLFRRPVTAQFTLSNTGRKSLKITQVRSSCGCTDVNYPQGEIPAGQSFQVSITYDAATMGHFEKRVGIYSNGSETPVVLALRGVVVEEVIDFKGQYPFVLGDVQAEANDIEFDNVNRSDRPYQRIHIYNNSTNTVEPVVMHLPPYLKAEVSPSKIKPHRGGTVTIILDPRSLRDFGLTQTSVYLGMYPGDKVSADKEISVSAVLLPNFENMTAEQLAAAPSLSLSTDSLKLGSFNGKKKLKGEIILTNKGRSTLDIRSLQMFTAGIQVSLSDTKIQPGQSAKMKITAIERILRSARSKPRILMITNDPNHTKVIINILVNKD